MTADDKVRRGNRSKLPRMYEVAARITAGADLAEIAATHGVSLHTLQDRLRQAGFDPATGKAWEKKWAPEPRADISTVQDKEWFDDARCRRSDLHNLHPNAWHPNINPGDTRTFPAQTECGKCPVRAKCLDYALHYEAEHPRHVREGIYGGLTPRQRAELARKDGAA